jgi:peptide/nickel transport system ATP-binding protein
MSEQQRTAEPVLDIRSLRTHFFTGHGVIPAVDGIDLSVPRGSTVCIVGESGSGKSVTARSVLQLVDEPGRIVGGQILFRPRAGDDPVDITTLAPKGAAMRAIRGRDIAMVFQEPMSSLSPIHTIGDQVGEMLRIHEGLSKKDVRDRVIDDLRGVGIPRPEQNVDAYTFQLSGGMRQRAMIAMALACRPTLLIADEPTTALDVTTQAQILDLLAELKERLGMSLLFITHDLGVVAEIADEVVVMRSGHVVERGPVDAIFHEPKQDYTLSLLRSLPQRRKTMSVSTSDTPIGPERKVVLDVRDLQMRFGRARRRRAQVVAVDGVSVRAHAGETLGIVGESGSGKTSLGRCILRAYKPSGGKISYTRADGTVIDLTGLSTKELRPYRHEIRPRSVQFVESPDDRARGDRRTVAHGRCGRCGGRGAGGRHAAAGRSEARTHAPLSACVFRR